MDSPAVLTKEQAKRIVEDCTTPPFAMFEIAQLEAMLAIQDGRTKVVPVRTEAEWRGRFEAWAVGVAKISISRDAADYFYYETEWSWKGYIAALRSLGLVRGE